MMMTMIIALDIFLGIYIKVLIMECNSCIKSAEEKIKPRFAQKIEKRERDECSVDGTLQWNFMKEGKLGVHVNESFGRFDLGVLCFVFGRLERESKVLRRERGRIKRGRDLSL